MFDTAIEDPHIWNTLSELTAAIEGESSIVHRWKLRGERTKHFADYLCELEAQSLALIGDVGSLASVTSIKKAILKDVSDAIEKSERWYS